MIGATEMALAIKMRREIQMASGFLF